MAYSKKVYYRRNRSSRYRRRAWRRKYRRNRYRRRYRRARRARPEYKRLEFKQKFTFEPSFLNTDFQTYYHIKPFFYDFCCIGATTPPGYLDKARCFNVLPGPGLSQRIGGKIRPTSLRLFGTISIHNYTQQFPDNNLINVGIVNGCMLRMIVFQVRNGNNDVHVMNSAFSAVNPFGVNVTSINNVDAPINQYNNRDQNYYLSGNFLSRLFSVDGIIRQDSERVNNVVSVYEGVLENNREYFGTYAKCPYKRGIGTYLKVLKDKLYHLNPTIAPSFAFRTKTKRPYRMVWLENEAQAAGTNVDCKNPIYIVFIPIFPEGVNGSDIEINFNCQFIYSDK